MAESGLRKREDALARVASLARKWQHETAHHSKVARRALHPA
jgi:hypothetical protein